MIWIYVLEAELDDRRLRDREIQELFARAGRSYLDLFMRSHQDDGGSFVFYRDERLKECNAVPSKSRHRAERGNQAGAAPEHVED